MSLDSWRFIGPQQRRAEPMPFRRYLHYKGGSYVVLGVAKHLYTPEPCPPAFAVAEYSEKRDIELQVGFWGCGDLFYYFNDADFYPGEDLVIYWSQTKHRFFARPLSVWDEWVEKARRRRFDLA